MSLPAKGPANSNFMQHAALAPVAGKADLEQVPSKWPFHGCVDESEPLPWDCAGTAATGCKSWQDGAVLELEGSERLLLKLFFLLNRSRRAELTARLSCLLHCIRYRTSRGCNYQCVEYLYAQTYLEILAC